MTRKRVTSRTRCSTPHSHGARPSYVKNKLMNRTMAGITATHDLGLPKNLIDAIIAGDQASAQKLGAMGNEGEKILQLMPQIVEQSKNFLLGQQEYNLGLAEIYTTGMQADVAIKGASKNLAKENLKRNLTLEQYKEEWMYDQRSLKNAHTKRMELYRVNKYLEWWLSEVNHQYSLQSTFNKLDLNQIREDIRWNLAAIEHNLEFGAQADTSLIAKKEYRSLPEEHKGIGQRLYAPVARVVRQVFKGL